MLLELDVELRRVVPLSALQSQSKQMNISPVMALCASLLSGGQGEIVRLSGKLRGAHS